MAAPATVGGEQALDIPLTRANWPSWEGELPVLTREPGYLPQSVTRPLTRGVLRCGSPLGDIQI